MQELTFTQVGFGFAIFTLFLSTAVQVATLLGMRRSQKREVSVVEMYATKGELQALAGAGDEGRRKLHEKIEALRLEVKGDVGEVHQKINDVSNQVSGVERDTTMINQTMVLMSQKLDRLSERSADAGGKR